MHSVIKQSLWISRFRQQPTKSYFKCYCFLLFCLIKRPPGLTHLRQLIAHQPIHASVRSEDISHLIMFNPANVCVLRICCPMVETPNDISLRTHFVASPKFPFHSIGNWYMICVFWTHEEKCLLHIFFFFSACCVFHVVPNVGRVFWCGGVCVYVCFVKMYTFRRRRQRYTMVAPPKNRVPPHHFEECRELRGDKRQARKAMKQQHHFIEAMDGNDFLGSCLVMQYMDGVCWSSARLEIDVCGAIHASIMNGEKIPFFFNQVMCYNAMVLNVKNNRAIGIIYWREERL